MNYADSLSMRFDDSVASRRGECSSLIINQVQPTQSSTTRTTRTTTRTSKSKTIQKHSHSPSPPEPEAQSDSDIQSQLITKNQRFPKNQENTKIGSEILSRSFSSLKTVHFQQKLYEFGYEYISDIKTTKRCQVFQAKHLNSNKVVVIKQVSASSNTNNSSRRNSKSCRILIEDLVYEASIMKRITEHLPRTNPVSSSMVRFIDLFKDNCENYYLVMEHGGICLFDFIVDAHQQIKNKKLQNKEWRKFVKYLMFQLCLLFTWLHHSTELQCCHLDISLENLLVSNVEWIQQNNGYLTLNRDIQIAICDFGFAEMFYSSKHSKSQSQQIISSRNNSNSDSNLINSNSNNNSNRRSAPIGAVRINKLRKNSGFQESSQFKCSKFCGKYQYMSPQIYSLIHHRSSLASNSSSNSSSSSDSTTNTDPTIIITTESSLTQSIKETVTQPMKKIATNSTGIRSTETETLTTRTRTIINTNSSMRGVNNKISQFLFPATPSTDTDPQQLESVTNSLVEDIHSNNMLSSSVQKRKHSRKQPISEIQSQQHRHHQQKQQKQQKQQNQRRHRQKRQIQSKSSEIISNSRKRSASNENHNPNIKLKSRTKPKLKPKSKSRPDPLKHERKEYFANKSDVWSLGIVFFVMSFGTMLYDIPEATSDKRFVYVARNELYTLLQKWKLTRRHLSQNMFDLMNHMLDVNEESRFSMIDVIYHPWFDDYIQNSKQYLPPEIQHRLVPLKA